MVAHDTAQAEATHDHPNEFPSSLVQGVLVGCRPGLVRSCLDDFYVGFGDAESFGSFGREEHAIVARKNLWVTLRKQNVRARCKCVATAIALEQQQRNCYLTLSWDLGYPLNRRYKNALCGAKLTKTVGIRVMAIAHSVAVGKAKAVSRLGCTRCLPHGCIAVISYYICN